MSNEPARGGTRSRSDGGRSAGAARTPRGARALRASLGLTQVRFAQVLGVSPRTLSKIEGGEAPTAAVRRRVTELRRLVEALADVVAVDAIAGWIDEPNEAFGGLRPTEVIERGEVDRLWAMIHDLRAGHPA